jgi:signal recognition particle receptor subunit beta
MNQLISNPLLAIRDHVVLLRNKLEEAKATELPNFRPYIDDQIKSLDEALAAAKIPDYYRVAIVGRFKVGKSSFVNKLTDERLAGVETSPETAAISLFRYADSTYAEVKFVPDEEWAELRAGYKEDPNNPAVKRYAGFAKFNERQPKRDKEGRLVPLHKADLSALESRWLRPGGHTHRIDAQNWKTKEGKAAFRREIKKYTSSQEPLHYLVDRLVIHSPIQLLGDNIELIDTPGLDDSEVFRVRLTEDLVKEVDAILFLTQSGASYSQSDKEFIVRQLRHRQIKHLQIIATKIDGTYDAKVHDARENDEEPPSFEDFCRKEEERIRGEVRTTLDELLATNQLNDDDGYYFLEQLDAVPIHLISTHYYDAKDLDRSGIPAVRDRLYEILSTSQRFEHSRKVLTDRLGIATQRIKIAFSGRLNAIEAEYNPEKVRAEIAKIRAELEKKLDFFGEQAATLVSAMADEQKALANIVPPHLDAICLLAERVFHELEKNDVGKHWQSKRWGYWGALSDLQSKVADLTFPKIELLLNKYIGHFRKFSASIATQLGHLEKEVRAVETSNALSGLEPLSLAEAHQKVLGEFEKLLADHAPNERDAILKQLNDFASQEIQTRIETARDEVHGIGGTGTTWRQNVAVAAFYTKVRQLLSAALRAHLEAHFNSFAEGLISQAKAVFPQIRTELLSRLDDRLKAIESTISLAATGQKNKITAYLSDMLQFLSALDTPTANDTSPFAGSGRLPQPATYEITDGATGYGYDRVFGPYMIGCESMSVDDPYIRHRHQLENFRRLCALAILKGKVKHIRLRSAAAFGKDVDEANGQLETLKRDLKQQHGVHLDWSRSEKMHNREVTFSNGWVVKSDRGLDIYHKPESWASVGASDYGLRKCRQTKIEAFRRDTALAK